MFCRCFIVAVVASQLLVGVARAQQAGHVFYIALENHNWTQPASYRGCQQLYGNPAAPYLNSLVNPADSNSAQVSYASNYYSAAVGLHPSETNYIWHEAGTNFGLHTNADPSDASGNLFANVTHLTGQLNAAGIAWKNYQEDVEYSTSPQVSAWGTIPGGRKNPYNGSSRYNYAVKHNPSAFFKDTGTQNTFPMTQLAGDLKNDTVGRYNWITPDQFNEMHSYLIEGFTYHGVHYAGDQAAVAQGDNCLSIIIPQIMACEAYKHDGMIVIWCDETEGGDTTAQTLPEIIISPLARGHAYTNNVVMSHSSDLKTMEEIFGLPLVAIAFQNPVPVVGDTSIAGANDLSSLMTPGAIPAALAIAAPPTTMVAGPFSAARPAMATPSSGYSLIGQWRVAIVVAAGVLVLLTLLVRLGRPRKTGTPRE